MSEKITKDNWFKSWFDSPFYHKLYASRDLGEAEFFIKNLVKHLDLKPNTDVLDLACGKGRHAYYLSQFGLNVLGLDLAANSILEAKKYESKNLQFDVHDMREVYQNMQFDCVFNLFTSFGYFDSEQDNLKMLQSVHSMLKVNGILVIDFMNAEKIVSNLVRDELKTIDETTFNIKRHFDGTHIFKEIKFESNHENFHFTERVQALKLEHFEKLFIQSGFELLSKFGDYALNEFDVQNSSRLILVAKKK